MSSSFSSSEGSTQDKYSESHDKYLGLDASSEAPSSEAAETPRRGTSSKTSHKASRNRRDYQKSYGPPRRTETEATHNSMSSDITEEVKHVRGSRRMDPSPERGLSEGSGSERSRSSKSPATIRSLRKLRSNRQRVPGGAAAKLFGKGMEPEDDQVVIEDDGDEALEVLPPSDELDRIRQEAIAEFAKGPKTNRRYHGTESSNQSSRRKLERSPSEASLPSILNRTEIFHENATAAVLSLLNPPDAIKDTKDGNGSVVSRGGSDFTQVPIPSHSTHAFKPPPRSDDDVSVAGSACSSSVAGLTASGKIQLQQPLLTKKAEQKLEKIAEQMISPNKTLSDLMLAIASPEDANFTRGYMVRRKNACGALQVLTANSVHRVQICWTLGVLPSITSVLEDGGIRDLSRVFPDKDTRREYVEARKRAVSALMNLSMPQENRLTVFHSPRLISMVIRTINQDKEESRKGCCAVLAQLAKTKENRLLLAQVPGLLDAITAVIEPTKPLPPVKEMEEEEKGTSKETPEEVDSIGSSDASAGAGDIIESFVSEEQISVKPSEGSASNAHVIEEDPVIVSKRYDSDPNVHLHGARQNIFAFLGHLLKEKDNAYHLARHRYLMVTLVAVSKLHDSPSHEHAVRLLAHLTRHRGNSKELVFKLRMVVPALVKATVSMNDEARKYACFALQNLSQDKPCRQELAVTSDLLTALCVRVRQASNPEERLAAIHALKNLTDEPANLIPMTNTPECFATLMQIAHASDDSVTEMMQYLGCDALATLSHWFRSIATSGQRIDTTKRGLRPSKDLFVPTLKIVTWQRWQ